MFRVVRRSDKRFHQEHWSGTGWAKGLAGAPKVLYNLPAVLAATNEGGIVWVVEGEKDADALTALDLVATTNPGGAGKWTDEHTNALLGAKLVNVVWDRDEEGQRHALQVVEALAAAGLRVRTLRAKAGKDVSDHLAAGHTLDQLVRSKPKPKQQATTAPPAASESHAQLPAVYQLALLRLASHAAAHKLPAPRQTSPTSWEACCPAHDDSSPSLGVRVGDKQPLVLMCQAGCEMADVAKALGISKRELSNLPNAEDDVAKEVHRLRVRDTARVQLANENIPPIEPPTMLLKEYLATAPKEVAYTIDQLHIAGGNTLLVAQFKAGKTTMLLNLMRAIADGGQFLDFFNVQEMQGRVGYLDYEMHGDQFRTWATQVGLTDSKHVATPWHLRGTTLPFWTPDGAEVMCKWLREQEVEMLIVDPAARAWSGLVDNENDNTEVGKFTEALDRLKKDAGVKDLILATHMGRARFEEGEERSRGATRLEDWADSLWYLTADRDTGVRALRAIGRSVDLEAVAIEFDPQTLRLRSSGQPRQEVRVDRGVQDVVDAVATLGDTPTTSDVAEAVEHSSRAAGKYIREAEARGYIERTKSGRSLICHLTEAGRQLHERKVTT